jgi:hypothetical protein
MSGNKAECKYLCRDKDHPSFLNSIEKNENPYEKYVGVCTASCDFPESVRCSKVTEEEIAKYCGTVLKYSTCTRHNQKIYGPFK